MRFMILVGESNFWLFEMVGESGHFMKFVSVNSIFLRRQVARSPSNMT